MPLLSQERIHESHMIDLIKKYSEQERKKLMHVYRLCRSLGIFYDRNCRAGNGLIHAFES